jgi:hypothetical protein
MYIYCAYPAISKSLKQLPYCLQITETTVVLIIFNDIICNVSAYSIAVSNVALHESSTRNALLVP